MIGLEAMSEVIFIAEEATEGGLTASVSVHHLRKTETVAELQALVRDAVRCHLAKAEMRKPSVSLVADELISELEVPRDSPARACAGPTGVGY